jgi:hypothetical protein
METYHFKRLKLVVRVGYGTCSAIIKQPDRTDGLYRERGIAVRHCRPPFAGALVRSVTAARPPCGHRFRQDGEQTANRDIQVTSSRGVSTIQWARRPRRAVTLSVPSRTASVTQ